MRSFSGFIVIVALSSVNALVDEFPPHMYGNCHVSATLKISPLRQKALNYDGGKPAERDGWMCFGSSQLPSIGRENSDNIGGLANKTITAAYQIESPYVMLETDEHGKAGEKLTGYFVDFWMRMEKMLKFKTKYVAMDAVNARDRLAMADVDVLLLPTVQNIEDERNFEFTLPVASHWYSLFLRRTKVSAAPDAHVRAMGYKMIFHSIGVICILVFSLWLSEVIGAWMLNESEYRLYYAIRRKRTAGRSNTESAWRRFLGCFTMISPGNCMLCVLGIFCVQSWCNVSKRAPTRILLISSFIFGYLLMNAYNGVLMSFLAAGSRDVPNMAHLEDIARSGETVLCVRKDTYVYSTFLESPKGPVRPVWRNLLNTRPCPPQPETTEELLQALCKGDGTVLERYTDTDPRVGVLEDPGVMAAALERPPAAQTDPHRTDPFNKCQIVRMRRRHIVSMVSLMLRRGFPHTTELNIEILRNRAYGLLDYLRRKWMGHDLLVQHAPLWDRTGLRPVPFTEVSLLHIRTLLHTFATSLLIPIFILLCEIIIWNIPWRHLQRQIYQQDVIQKGEGLSGPPARAILPKLTAHLKRGTI